MSAPAHLEITIRIPKDLARLVRASAALNDKTVEEFAAYQTVKMAGVELEGAGSLGSFHPESIGEEAADFNPPRETATA